jgi:hypothetical protein
MKFPAEPPLYATPDRNCPDSTTFEVWGYFLEVWDARLNACLGTRRTERIVGRGCGSEDKQTSEILEITETFEVQRGHKRVRIPASPSKPMRVWTRYLPICGHRLNAA